MKSIIALFVILPSFAQAFCETYSRYGGPEVICFEKEVKALVSEECLKGCEAVKFLKENNKRPTEIDRVGGKNPATQYCKAYDLKVHILKDPRGAEQSYCKFNDGSLVDAGAFSRSLR